MPNMVTQRLACIAVAATGLLLTAGIAESDDMEFAHKANMTCRAILNERPLQVVHDGNEAAAGVLAAFMDKSALDDEDRENLRAALIARRDEFRRSAKTLASLVPPQSLSASWKTLVDYVSGEAALSDSRLDWLDGRSSSLAPAANFGPDVRMVEEALERLGLARRDCELIAQDLGIPEEDRAFLRSVAAICTGIIDRRFAQGYAQDMTLSVETLADALGGDLTLPRQNVEAALLAMEKEWRQSASDLANIPEDIVTQPIAWELFRRAFNDMAELQAARLAVMRSSSMDPSADYMAVPRPRLPYDEMEVLGLDRTDCRNIAF